MVYNFKNGTIASEIYYAKIIIITERTTDLEYQRV